MIIKPQIPEVQIIYPNRINTKTIKQKHKQTHYIQNTENLS